MYTLRQRLGKGFTLIELLIVITIIGILAVALVPRITGAPAAARDAGRKAAVNNIVVSVESYLNDNGKYPGTAAGNNGVAECLVDAPGNTGDLLAPYMGDQLPKDPLASREIAYTTDKNCGITNDPEEGAFWYTTLGNGVDSGTAVKGYMVGALLEKNTGNNLGCFAGVATTACDSTADAALVTNDAQGDGYISFSTI